MNINTAIKLLILMALTACTSTPDAEELPDNEALVEVLEPAPDQTEDVQFTAVDSPEDSQDPLDERKSEAALPVTRLKLKDVKGGKISFEAPGHPKDICQALLDFSGNSDHRAWITDFEALPSENGVQMAKWYFEGRSGINPTVVLGFRYDENEVRHRIRYRLVQPDFGLGAFFGDIVVTTSDQDPAYSTITERTFIDSGVWIANASYEDIEDGLREDARLIVPWLEKKFGTQP